MAKDYYQTLGISKTADSSQIKKAYRDLARKHHPDVDKSEGSEKRFKEINEAYQVLSDSQKRATYDQFGSQAFEGGGPNRAGSRWQEGPGGYRYQTYSWGPQGGSSDFDFSGFSDPFDIFEMFFGTRSPSGQGARLQRFIFPLDFMEAVKGCEKEVEISGKKIKVKVPAGVDDGSEIRFQDFILICQVRGNGQFKRQGYDLFSEKKLNFSQAALGDTVEVETIDGPLKLRVPAGTQPHTQIRLQGKGVPHVRGSGRGDHYVSIRVEVPTKLSSKQKKLLEELERI